MPRALLAGLTIMLIASAIPAAAQGFVPDGDDFLLTAASGTVRYTPPGRWQASVEGGRTLTWEIVLWHGEWVYEHLSLAPEVEGPVLTEDGALELSGSFVKADGAAPIEFTLRMTPTDTGLAADFRVRKTGDLWLRRGVILLVQASRDQFGGTETVYLAPNVNATMSVGAGGAGDALGVALDDTYAARFSPVGVAPVEFRPEANSYGHRMRLTPDNFAAGQWQDASWRMDFSTIPSPLPGQILPGKGPLGIAGATWDQSSIPIGQHAELTVDLSAAWTNPFDPDDVALDAEFTAPSGRTLAVPGFFMVDMQGEVVDGDEVVRPMNTGRWCVRFSPDEVGPWRCRLLARDRTGEVAADAPALTATARDGHGFVRVSPVDPHYFAFDDGAGYFPIGHNLPIYHTRGQLGPQGMAKFAAAGENYNRWWMCSYGFGIEWEAELGWYRQPSAWRIDSILEQARDLGMYYMMCMDTHQDFRLKGWEANPYNAARGGPCATPNDWFTDPSAREQYRKRLRYTVARWGYSPHVLCWEFGNEIQGWAGASADDQLAWHAEMSDYLRAIDPWNHLITTSFWGGVGDGRFWELPAIDIVQTHNYANADMGLARVTEGFCREQWERWDKPHLFAEFGISSSGAVDDPEGWNIHNTLWAGITNMCAGAPMPWWHENYIDPKDLYFHFTAIASFTRDLPLGTARWQPLDEVAVAYQDPAAAPPAADLVLHTFHRWGKPADSEFTLLPDGSIEGDLQPQQLLQGIGHKELKNPPVFIVNYPEPGRFILRVERVSNSGDLTIAVDGQQVLRREFPTGEGLGKSSLWREQWNLWETVYNEDIAVDVPAGEHRIRVENNGRDWIRVPHYTFTGCRTLNAPDVYAYGMRSEEVTVLWLQNRASIWRSHYGEEAIPAIPAFTAIVPDVTPGPYLVQRWETWRGTVTGEETIDATGGVLRIDIDPLAADLALQIRPVAR